MELPVLSFTLCTKATPFSSFSSSSSALIPSELGLLNYPLLVVCSNISFRGAFLCNLGTGVETEAVILSW
uniref:Uncharacterized protein n=1 Tax=Salix viminalis TaxID=40686 RepID=A0A6N2L1F7_SALVM